MKRNERKKGTIKGGMKTIGLSTRSPGLKIICNGFSVVVRHNDVAVLSDLPTQVSASENTVIVRIVRSSPQSSQPATMVDPFETSATILPPNATARSRQPT
jgi:hypothetical protein